MSGSTGQSQTKLRSFGQWLPGLDRFRTYQRSWFVPDAIAGLILVTFLVPQGMAYAALAGLPPVNGLYASMIPLLAYALLGPSRVLILAPDSAIAPMVAAAIIPISGADMDARVAAAGTLAVLVGIFCIIGGSVGLGFFTDLISRPVRVGYLAGIALAVIVSQIPNLLGLDGGGERVIQTLRDLAPHLDDVDIETAMIGFGSLVALLIVNRVRPRWPGALLVIAGAMLLNRFLDFDVEEVGSLPSGLPGLALPIHSTTEIGSLVFPALAIAIMAFADTSILSGSYASRLGDEVDPNQELRALGGANFLTGLFQGFPISSSSSRTPVAEQAGARSPLAGVVSAIALGGVLLFASDAFGSLPTTALSAVLVVAALRLIDLEELRRLWTIYRPDCYLAIAALVGVAGFGVLWGIGFGIVLSIAAFLWRAWHPHVAVLGRSAGVKGYHDITRYPEALQIPGLLLFRFDAPIFFANAQLFRESVIGAIKSANRPIERVVIAAEPITDLDSTAAETIATLDNELSASGIELAFAELRDPMKDRLRSFGLIEKIGRESFYPTLGVAVRDYVVETGIDWVDWEERAEQLLAAQPSDLQP